MSLNFETSFSKEQTARRLSPEVAMRLLARCAGLGSAENEVSDDVYLRFIRGDLPVVNTGLDVDVPDTQHNRDAA